MIYKDDIVVTIYNLKLTPEFAAFGKELIMACYYAGGGIAEKIMMKQAQLNLKSMEYDLEQLHKQCIANNTLNESSLYEAALSVCERFFIKMECYLITISEMLIESAIKNQDSVGLSKYELLNIISNIKRE